MADNVKVSATDSELTIKINLKSKGIASKSGKTNVIASTRGFLEVGDGFRLGLNLIKKA